jgi:predicted MPP superfamily phosphohydrolase
MSRRTFTIVHLSDLHFGNDAQRGHSRLDYWQDTLSRELRRALKDGHDASFVVVSGDLTLTGKRAEFDAVDRFLTALAADAAIPHDRFLIVPGNHDFERSRPSGTTEQLSNYRTFHKSFTGRAAPGACHATRVFEDEKVAYILLDSSLLMQSPRAPEELQDIDRTLRSPELQGYLRVAVIHHSPEHIERYSPDDPSRTIGIQQFLERWRVALVLHGHSHGPETWMQKRRASGDQFSCAASTSLGEPWRAFGDDLYRAGYNALMVKQHELELVRWAYYPARGVWEEIERVSMPLEQRHAVAETLSPSWLGLRSSAQEIHELYERVADLPLPELELLVRELGPSVRPYSPVTEPRRSYAKRLVDYFEDNRGLPVLVKALDRIRVSPARLQVFLSYTSAERYAAEKLSACIRRLGHDVWIDKERLGPGADWTEAITEGLLTSDALVLLLSGESSPSSYVANEAKMWYAAGRGARLVPVVIGKAEVDPFLQRRRAIVVDKVEDFDKESFQTQLEAAIVAPGDEANVGR